MGLPLVGIVLLLCVGPGLTCSITDFVDMKMMERLVQSTYVVYGRTTYQTPTKVIANGRTSYVVDATYEVHCILKEGEDEMSEMITISQISPEPDCFGTDVSQNLKVGDYSIIALKNTTGGKYKLEEVMPALSASFHVYKPYFFTLSNLCGLQRWKSPRGATSQRCPICGISNFASEVTALDNSAGGLTNCEFHTSGIVSNMTACDLFIKGTVDYANAQSCVPASFNDTCVSLLHRASTATCDCNRKPNNNNVGTADARAFGPCKFLTVLALLLYVSVKKNNQ